MQLSVADIDPDIDDEADPEMVSVAKVYSPSGATAASTMLSAAEITSVNVFDTAAATTSVDIVPSAIFPDSPAVITSDGDCISVVDMEMLQLTVSDGVTASADTCTMPIIAI